MSLTFNEAGTQAFAEATGAKVGQQIDIVYDNSVVSGPVVNSELQGADYGLGCYERRKIWLPLSALVPFRGTEGVAL